jgi:alpha-L-fucosidase
LLLNLEAIGRWMKTHSRAIYGTRGGPYMPTKNYVSTRNGKTIYVHAFDWSSDSVTLPALPAKVVGAKVLGGGNVKYAQNADGLTITVPSVDRDAADTVVALKLTSSAMDISPISTPILPLAKMSASNVYRADPAYGAEKAYDDQDSTRWATDDGTKTAWLEADFPKPTKLTGVVINEAYAGRVQSFQLQYRPPGGSDWITIKSGTHLGDDYKTTFLEIIAQSFRLNILDSTDGPTISEISFPEPQ